MATEKSRRTIEQRKRDYDQISFVAPKGCKYLAKAQALREGITTAEMIRRAILARCGLSVMPDFDSPHYSQLVTVLDREGAERAIHGLQLDEHIKERGNDDLYMSIMLSSKTMKAEYITALLDLLDALGDSAEPGEEWTQPTQIKTTRKTMATIRRLLSNIVIDDAEGESDGT